MYTKTQNIKSVRNMKCVVEVRRDDNSKTYLPGSRDEIQLVRRVPRILRRPHDFFHSWRKYCNFFSFLRKMCIDKNWGFYLLRFVTKSRQAIFGTVTITADDEISSSRTRKIQSIVGRIRGKPS